MNKTGFESPVLQQILKSNGRTIMDVADMMQDIEKKNEKMKEEIDESRLADVSPDMVYELNKNKKPYVRKNHVGRNDLCPCGSGKKYKNCCLKTGEYEE